MVVFRNGTEMTKSAVPKRRIWSGGSLWTEEHSLNLRLDLIVRSCPFIQHLDRLAAVNFKLQGRRNAARDSDI